jgi:threonyl-tRNA synthetase
MVIWNLLEDLRRSENEKRGYVEVRTPVIYEKTLWETSGHWEKFREHMFLIPEGERTYGVKPMNCPGHVLVFGNRMRRCTGTSSRGRCTA